MSSGVALSPRYTLNKTRNAILRMKKCSPELRTVLRQRCRERIQNERTKILNSLRNIKIQDSFRIAFGNILKEEWRHIDDELNEKPSQDLPSDFLTCEFNFDNELAFEELLEKEMLLEHENWLLQLYEELLHENFHEEESSEVVCPVCRLGYLKQIECQTPKRALCSKCQVTFTVEKSLHNFQAAIYECIKWHDRQCDINSGFVVVPKSENEANLCVVCHNCSYLNVIE